MIRDRPVSITVRADDLAAAQRKANEFFGRYEKDLPANGALVSPARKFVTNSSR